MTARRSARPAITRRTFTGAAALTAAAGMLAACTDDEGGSGGGPGVQLVSAPPDSAVLPGTDVAGTAVALSAALFESADVAVVAAEDTVDDLVSVATDAGLPLLVGTDEAVIDELERLGADTIVTSSATDLGALGDGFEVVEHDAEDAEVPDVSTDDAQVAVTLLVDPGLELDTQPLATALVEAAGGAVAEIPDGDLGRSSESIEAAEAAAGDDPATGVLALGESFGDTDALPDALDRAISTPQLPGGGLTAFPGRRMIAAYGSPDIPSLGILGEQGVDEAIERVQELADEYEGLADEPIIPAFEIISTIASSSAGSDGNYSSEISVDTLRPWVDAAGEAGVYAVLDLQPGHNDFLTQAKLYEELLLEPHVGLALDPEWRLAPGQQHMVQIGSVSAEEINETSAWLADLTAENGLPQKVFILHQFSLSMITDREDVDTSRPELAITLHADGHGVPENKFGTYEVLQQDLPDGIFMAWKNFYDEDTPMFTPEETFDVEPRPWFVSYQ